MTAVVMYLFMTGAELLFCWLLLKFINLTSAISNRACCNSSVFDLCPSYTKFLPWHRLMTFDGNWMFSRERHLFSILHYIILLILHFPPLFSHYFPFCILSFNGQQVQLGTWPWTLKFQENFRAGKKRFILTFSDVSHKHSE